MLFHWRTLHVSKRNALFLVPEIVVFLHTKKQQPVGSAIKTEGEEKNLQASFSFDGLALPVANKKI